MLYLIVVYIITTFQPHAGFYGCAYVYEDGSGTLVLKALIKSGSFVLQGRRLNVDKDFSLELVKDPGGIRNFKFFEGLL